MPKDIRPLGAADGKACYWVKDLPPGLRGAVGCLRLVLIDEQGEIHSTPMRARWDPAAMTRAEAVEAHLAGAVTEADRELERRRREAPEPEPKPAPMDPATRRFLMTD
ncbi:MAG: hypothetical protein AABM42_10055 [Actinomycetota bacterium]